MRLTTELPAAHRAHVAARRDGSRLWRLIHRGGSLHLAMVLLLTIASACAVATITESRFNGDVARHYIYKAPWFLAWLGVLCLNLFCVTLTRWPWRREHLGFVITHYGIITLLAGAVVGRLWGFEGFMSLDQGAPQNRVVLKQTVAQIRIPQTGRLYEIALDPEARPPTEARPWDLPLPEEPGLALRLDGYAEHLAAKERLAPGGEKPGVALRLQTAMMGQELSLVLLAGDPRPLFTLARIEWTKPATDLPTLQLSPPKDGAVPYVLWRKKKAFASGVLRPGQPVPLGWADWQATLLQAENRAHVETYFLPGNDPADAGGLRAVLLRDGKPFSVAQWIPSGEERLFPTPSGRSVPVAFGLKTRPLPFAVTLLRFEVPRDEGTANPADFIATIRFDGAGRQAIGQAHMNYPASFPGGLWRSMLGLNYKFSQSSWDPSDLDRTTLQVLFDPGWPLKWIGALLVVTGVALLFYFKPTS